MTSTSVHQKFSGLLIVIGSLAFVCGGAFHPRINSSLGALGSTEFFQNFYMHIAHHGSWRLIHGMILVGPVLWLLGIGSLWSGRNGWTRMATTAMTLAATAWAVTFVFDGFVAPDIVRWLTPETGWHVLAVNQDVVIRLGLVSWLMLGFAMIAGSVGDPCFEPVQDCEGVGLARHLARSVAICCLGDGDIPSWSFHKPVLECNRGQHGILVPCRRSLSPGFCPATEWSGACRRTFHRS